MRRKIYWVDETYGNTYMFWEVAIFHKQGYGGWPNFEKSRDFQGLVWTRSKIVVPRGIHWGILACNTWEGDTPANALDKLKSHLADQVWVIPATTTDFFRGRLCSLETVYYKVGQGQHLITYFADFWSGLIRSVYGMDFSALGAARSRYWYDYSLVIWFR